MASEQRDGEEGPPPAPALGGWREALVDRWLKTREHAETYPYVWGSYILVYGGLGLYITYRWRKLRAMEKRVRILQEELRKLVEAEESAAAADASVPSKPNGGSSPTSTTSAPSDKPTAR